MLLPYVLCHKWSVRRKINVQSKYDLLSINLLDYDDSQNLAAPMNRSPNRNLARWIYDKFHEHVSRILGDTSWPFGVLEDQHVERAQYSQYFENFFPGTACSDLLAFVQIYNT